MKPVIRAKIIPAASSDAAAEPPVVEAAAAAAEPYITVAEAATEANAVIRAAEVPKKAPIAVKKRVQVKLGVSNAVAGAVGAAAAADDLQSNYSYLGKSIENTYERKEARQHILDAPDTYAGSKQPQEEEVWVMGEDGRMVFERVSFRECLYKIFDEILVNAIDQYVRLAEKIKNGFPKLHPVKKISVTLSPETGYIIIENDGEGMDVVKHAKEGIYVPQMILGELLTSANYDKTEERKVGGKNGYGAKLANIFSKEFSLETVDSVRKLLYRQTWRDNMSVTEPPVITSYTKAPYTKITMLPDYAYFEIQNPAVISDWKMFKKRAYDVAACTDSSVSVYLNGSKIATKTFEDYINLYIGKKSECKRVFQVINDRWEVAICLDPEGEGQQVSFVNSLCTDRGGRHINHVIDNLADKIMESLSEKDKKSLVIKPAFIKKNLFAFVRCTVVNPSFDTQTKRKLTTLVKDFGSRCVLPDQFVHDVVKLGILDRAKNLAEFKAREDLGKKTDGRKHGKIYHPNLHDADEHARKHEFLNCTIVFTEGNGAATFMSKGIEGLPMEKRKYWGWFPLRGKILNVQSATIKQLANNEEIKMMKQIIGLQEKADYSNDTLFKQLRYGRVVILADADDDGHHIRGLFMNFLGHYWPSLLKRRGFLCDIATPIIKVEPKNSKKKGKKDAGDALEFFTIDQFTEWHDKNGLSGWKDPKYYKGLGTYEPTEARALCADMRVTEYVWNADKVDCGDGTMLESSEYNLMKLGFSKGFEEDRKGWLNDGHVPKPDIPCKGKINTMTIDSFVHNRLKIFSLTDNRRSIPALADGFKPAPRQIIFTCLLEGLNTETTVGVPTIMGAVVKSAGYHHGDAALEGTITGMADDYVGTNNIRLLYPGGGFGSRLGGGPKFKKGEDCSPARYISTKWTSIAPLILNKMDTPLLEYRMDDGKQVEPLHYLPTYPLILNGDRGIGTGWSTFIPSFNPEEVIANTRAILTGVTVPYDLHPWWRGYHGKIIPLSPGKYLTVGNYHQLDANSIRVTEIPIGSKDCKSFKQYKEFLNSLLDDDVAKLHGVEVKKKVKGAKRPAGGPKTGDSSDDSSDKSKSFKAAVILDYKVVSESSSEFIVDIYFKDGVLDNELANNTEYIFEKKLKLAYVFSTTNMHAVAPDGKVTKYATADDLLRAFISFRLPHYERRRQYWMGSYKFDHDRASAQYRFVGEIKSKKLQIIDESEAEIDRMLSESDPSYPKYALSVEKNSDLSKHNYDYLLNMHIRSFSKETQERLAREVEKYQTLYHSMRDTTAELLWQADLDALAKEYKEYNLDWAERNGLKLPAPRKSIQVKTKISVSGATASSKETEALTSKAKTTIKVKPKAVMVTL